jgi:uncharacterized protein (TIGR00661 family)
LVQESKTILVAPLHWGLGHATRCIPLIRALLKEGYKVCIASDGAALSLLRKEFPDLPWIELPSYSIRYSKKPAFFKWKLLRSLPAIRKTMAAEKKVINKLVEEGKVDGIISDNRFGVHSQKVPSVFVTHQLKVLSGVTSFFSSKMHQRIISKFDECWVPDVDHEQNLSGKLGHGNTPHLRVRYIGPLSRMKKIELPKCYDLLVLLSGPEPQRTLLEGKIMTELSGKDCTVLLVQGVVENDQRRSVKGNIEIVNYMKTNELERAINRSEVIVSRSGYTTIMDLAALGKKAFFIPTPGQYEQEYLASRFKALGWIPACKQQAFSYGKLDKIKVYKGFPEVCSEIKGKDLFGLFQGKGKLGSYA